MKHLFGKGKFKLRNTVRMYIPDFMIWIDPTTKDKI